MLIVLLGERSMIVELKVESCRSRCRQLQMPRAYGGHGCTIEAIIAIGEER